MARTPSCVLRAVPEPPTGPEIRECTCGRTTMSFHDRFDDVVDWAADHIISKGKGKSFLGGPGRSQTENKEHEMTSRGPAPSGCDRVKGGGLFI